MGAEIDPLEHAFILPDSKHAFAGQVGQIRLALGSVVIAQQMR
jgi:hypothetical protein